MLLVSPFMPFNTATKTTDIMMFNSRNLGALIVDQEPHVVEWDEPQHGIRNLAIEEKYGFGVLNEGQAIAVARNVKLTHNALVEPARSIISIGPDSPDDVGPAYLIDATPIDVLADRGHGSSTQTLGESRRARLLRRKPAAAVSPPSCARTCAGRQLQCCAAPGGGSPWSVP